MWRYMRSWGVIDAEDVGEVEDFEEVEDDRDARSVGKC